MKPIDLHQFESRKGDHIRLSLDSKNQATGLSDFSRVQLIHEALPDLDFEDIDLSTHSLNLELSAPFLVSSMTAGHVGGVDLNLRLAKACQGKSWVMGVGSQRRELSDPEAHQEWKALRKHAPKVRLLGNIGLSQLIKVKNDQIEKLVDSLEASGMIVHLNILQECLQPEGTPQFKGGLQRIESLVKDLSVPVVLKETGCGFSEATLMRLRDTGVSAVDVSGSGGTHWGRIEGGRASDYPKLKRASEVFADWGISTLESVLSATKLGLPFEVWASGGVRSGLDAAKALAMGSQMVGFAKPLLETALQSEEELFACMEQFEFELKMALICTGCRNLNELRSKEVWKWRT